MSGLGERWRNRRSYRQRQCTHPPLHVRSIHGDEIYASGGKRGHCNVCGLWLDALPAPVAV